jgi:PASTA domain
VSFLKTGASAISKLFIVIALAGTFLVGMFGTVYLALRGEELKVPEIVGKDFVESEKELTAMGLKIKRRADRFSEEKPNTVLEQLPRAGDTVKSGQMILVVVSKTNPEGTEAPATVKKPGETTDEVGDIIDPDKAKKTNKNSNVKRPTQTTRDVSSNKSTKNANVNSATTDSSNSTTKSGANTGTTTTSGNKNSSTTPTTKPTPNPVNSPKPAASKTPTSGETRTRKVP